VRAGLRPELAERLQEAEFLWRSSRADFLLPALPRETSKQEHELPESDLRPRRTAAEHTLSGVRHRRERP
jgi:hypothetical protein